jgi:hypothetical protein
MAPIGVTIPLEDVERLMTDLVNTLRKADQLPAAEPNDIGLAIRGRLDAETREVRSVLGVRPVPGADATQPMSLRIVCETRTGRLEIPISHTGAVELEEALHNSALARGSA